MSFWGKTWFDIYGDMMVWDQGWFDKYPQNFQ